MDLGDVWSVALPPSGGREQSGERPAIVLQDAAYGGASPLVLIAPLTSQMAAMRFPGSVRIDATSQNGLSLPSVAMVFQTRAIDRSRFLNRLGAIGESEIGDILQELDRLTGR